jgi:hypothetical protein
VVTLAWLRAAGRAGASGSDGLKLHQLRRSAGYSGSPQVPRAGRALRQAATMPLWPRVTTLPGPPRWNRWFTASRSPGLSAVLAWPVRRQLGRGSPAGGAADTPCCDLSSRRRRCGRLSAWPTAGVRRPPDAPARRAPGQRRGKLLSGACIPRRRDGFHRARARHRGTVQMGAGSWRRTPCRPRGPAGKHRHHVPLSRQPVAHRLQQDDFAEEAAEDSRDRGVSACIESAYQRRDVVAGYGMHFRGQV